MADTMRYVSKKTQAILENAEREHPDKISVAIEEDPKDQQHEDFKEVPKTEISLDKIFGESLIKKKEKEKMEEIKLNREIENKDKFTNIVTFRDKVFTIQEGKYYSLRLLKDAHGAYLSKHYSILLNGKRLCKKQPSNEKLMSFWVFSDEKFRVTESVQNAETKEYQYPVVGEIDVPTLKIMIGMKK